MKLRIPDILLLIAFVVGGVLAWQTARERGRLEADYLRLSLATGDLPISDPAKVQIRALETGEPLHFAWRVYLPPNSTMDLRSRSGFGSGSFSASGADFIARVRLRPDEEGNWSVYQAFQGSSSRRGLGDKELATFLRGRADRILVEQLGVKGVATIEPKGSAVLLRLSFPEDIQAEIRKSFPGRQLDRFLPDFFRVEIGPEPPKPAPPSPGS